MSSSKIWLLEQFDFWSVLKKDDIEYLDTHLVKKRIMKNEHLMLGENVDSIFFLKKGVMKITTYHEEGRECTKYLLKRGSIFGELPFSITSGNDDYAVALEDSVICYLHENEFNRILEKNHALNNEINKMMGSKMIRLHRRIESIVFKDSKTRVQEFLNDLKNDYGQQDENGNIVVKNFLTHKEIAGLTSTSRQFVTKILSEMKMAGSIDYNKDYIIFPSCSAAEAD